MNYKDNPAQGACVVAELGNPYEFNIVDARRTLGVDLGVYGAPESFLVDASGTIVYKRVGDVNRRVWERRNQTAPRCAREVAPRAGAPHG